MAFTLLQVGWSIWVLGNQKLWVVVSGCVVNAAAVAGWVATRFVGISFIGGLETTEKPQPAEIRELKCFTNVGLASFVKTGTYYSKPMH